MLEIPLFDDGYREALLYLMDQIDRIKFCSDTRRPWFPKDRERLAEALRIYQNWHPDPRGNFILDFPWPEPGEIPQIPDSRLKPSAEEKKKIQDFIDKHEGSPEDPLTETIVYLAKEL